MRRSVGSVHAMRRRVPVGLMRSSAAASTQSRATATTSDIEIPSVNLRAFHERTSQGAGKCQGVGGPFRGQRCECDGHGRRSQRGGPRRGGRPSWAARSSNKARFDIACVIQEAVDHIFLNKRERLATEGLRTATVVKRFVVASSTIRLGRDRLDVADRPLAALMWATMSKIIWTSIGRIGGARRLEARHGTRGPPLPASSASLEYDPLSSKVASVVPEDSNECQTPTRYNDVRPARRGMSTSKFASTVR